MDFKKIHLLFILFMLSVSACMSLEHSHVQEPLEVRVPGTDLFGGWELTPGLQEGVPSATDNETIFPAPL